MSRTFYHLRLLTFICPPHAAGLDDIRGKAAWLHAVVNQKQDFSFAFLYVKLWLGWWDSNPRIKESKSFALAAWLHPNENGA